MALTGAHAPGATPLTEQDIRGLKLGSITTRGELVQIGMPTSAPEARLTRFERDDSSY